MFSLFLSFLTGLVAALNPCTAPIYPIVFSYYLKREGKVTISNVLQFCAGFLGAFLIVALVIVGFGTLPELQEFIRFVAAGVVALLGIHFLLRGMHMPTGVTEKLARIKSPLLFGAVFGLALNPCSLPLFITTIAITAVDTFSVINIIAFGIGVALPPLMAAIFGAALIKRMAARIGSAYSYLNEIVGIFLIIAAGFIIWAVSASPAVAVAASVFILLFFILLVAPFWRQIAKARTHRNALYLLTGFLFMLWGVITFHCYLVSFSTQYTCHTFCPTCRLCTTLLVLVLVIGYLGFHFLEKKSR